MKILVLLLLCSLAYSETYMGVHGEWVEAIATAYSPYDEIDKGRADTQDDFTADMTNFKEVPYGIATGFRSPKIMELTDHNQEFKTFISILLDRN